MQLAVLLLLMLMGGNANLKEVRPLLESIDKDAAGMLDKAEEIGAVVSAVRAMASAPAPAENNGGHSASETAVSCGYPLAPVAPIADEGITYALSKYITLGE